MGTLLVNANPCKSTRRFFLARIRVPQRPAHLTFQCRAKVSPRLRRQPPQTTAREDISARFLDILRQPFRLDRVIRLLASHAVGSPRLIKIQPSLVRAVIDSVLERSLDSRLSAPGGLPTRTFCSVVNRFDVKTAWTRFEWAFEGRTVCVQGETTVFTASRGA